MASISRLLHAAAGLAAGSTSSSSSATTTTTTSTPPAPPPSLLAAATAPLRPLHGGGFCPAFFQAASFYYAVAALLAWVVPRLLPVRGIQPAPPRPGDAWRDARGSVGPLAVKAAIWALVEALHARGLAPLVYTGPALWPPPALAGVFGGSRGPEGAGAEGGGGGGGGGGGAARAAAAAASGAPLPPPSSPPPSSLLASALYGALCVLALDLLHDAWFYWTHRLLHTKPLYRRVHRDHHLSRAPTPFTGYSFHVAEAALVFANEVLVCYVVPLHLGLHRAYHLLTGAVHQAGHAGYELAPFVPTVGGVAAYAVGCAAALARAVAGAVVAPRPPAPSPAASDDGSLPPASAGKEGSPPPPAAASSFFFWGGGVLSPPVSRAPSAHGSSSSSSGRRPQTAPAAASWLAAAARGLLAVPPPSPLLNTVQHHDLHHRHPRLHFSLYFTHWDRLMGTLHPRYDEALFRYGAAEQEEQEEEERPQAEAEAEEDEGEAVAAAGARRRRAAG
jgi:sterol desaturase/sphingolipid hydroxylase (fatty acid hydroxylase superfamily)